MEPLYYIMDLFGLQSPQHAWGFLELVVIFVVVCVYLLRLKA